MAITSQAPAAGTDHTHPGCSSTGRVTRSLLGYGMLAGPLYVAVSLVQAATRDGFDVSRHEWSLLALGPGGWLQVTNLIVIGLMVLAAAVGYRRALTAGTGSRWAPRLLAVYGTGLVVAGVFRADPMNGFPLGTPDGPPADPTVHGTLHLAAAGAGFLALTAACWVLARRFQEEGHAGQAWSARAVGAAFLVAFAGLGSGATSSTLNLAFTAAVVLIWGWLSLTSAHLYKNVA